MLLEKHEKEELFEIFNLLQQKAKVDKDVLIEGLITAAISPKGLKDFRGLALSLNNRQVEYFEDEIHYEYKEKFLKNYLKNKIELEIKDKEIKDLKKKVEELTSLLIRRR